METPVIQSADETAKMAGNPVVAEALDYLGGDSAVAKRAGLRTAWGISKWRQKLPESRALWLARETGFKYTPHMLMPSMYPNPTDALPPELVLARFSASHASAEGVAP